MKIVLAPNAFKDSLTATEVAVAMATGVRKILPSAEIVAVPVADGGDGLLNVVLEALGCELRTLTVTGPLNQLLAANFGYVKSRDLVIVEMALASGLALLPKKLQDPTLTTTFGTGELIKAGLDLGVRQIYVGIGGSATTDGGIGMAQALGVHFLDKYDRELPGIGKSLTAIAKIDISELDPRIKDCTIKAVCDVENPLYGPEGAAFIYGPQKGANPEQVQMLDDGLKNLARRIKEDLGIDVKDLPGAGAAGGLGAGLHTFIGAQLCKGVDLIFDLLNLPEKLSGADLVLTGEGQIDSQTVFGKAPGAVGLAAQAQGIPCFAIAGSIGKNLEPLHQSGINAIFALCPGPISLAESMKFAKENVARVTEQIIRAFLTRPPL